MIHSKMNIFSHYIKRAIINASEMTCRLNSLFGGSLDPSLCTLNPVHHNEDKKQISCGFITIKILDTCPWDIKAHSIIQVETRWK